MAKKKKVTLPPYIGDHGTGTLAAKAGTFIEPITDENGNNPNRQGRRRREEVIGTIKLSMRQLQAAQDIRNAWCRKEMLSSGDELKEQVDGSPRPDRAIAAQIDAISAFKYLMDAVPRNMTYVVEHVCCANLPLRRLSPKMDHMGCHSANLKVALDLVANRKGY